MAARLVRRRVCLDGKPLRLRVSERLAYRGGRAFSLFLDLALKTAAKAGPLVECGGLFRENLWRTELVTGNQTPLLIDIYCSTRWF
jgi:hypothetical protein